MADADATNPNAAARQQGLTRITVAGETVPESRWIATEMPVGIEVNGLGYAVLMATPTDLVDLATGFALADRLIEGAGDLLDVDPFVRDEDVVVRITLGAAHADRVRDRVRHRATDSSCGLCGIENLEQALRPLPQVSGGSRADDAAVFRALAALEEAQSLNRLTRAVHAAALCDAEGAVRLIREDVGRHNAFDKLIGAMARGAIGWDGGFALLTSRCSFELVEKAVLADCPMLVTVSAPTSLALDRARASGLRLKVLARSDALLDCG